MSIKYILLALSSVIFIGCTSGRAVLPDEGPTTKEVYDQHIGGGGSEINNTFKRDKKGKLIVSGSTDVSDQKSSANMPWTAVQGERIMPLDTGRSSLVANELDSIKRDFRKVQNPEIVGYVYPHISNNEHPVPGYFTAFNLYTADHYATSNEVGEMATVRFLKP